MCVHSTLPVASLIAITFDSMSCRYTTPFTTTGVVAYPSATPAVAASPVDSIGTHHATPSCATFEAVIALATSRVFCRLAPGRVHAAATPGLGELAGAALAELAGAGLVAPACLPEQLGALACGVLPEQPATARPAAASTVTPATPVRVTKHLIWRLSRLA